MDERAELPFPLSRSFGQEHTCEQVRCKPVAGLRFSFCIKEGLRVYGNLNFQYLLKN